MMKRKEQGPQAPELVQEDTPALGPERNADLAMPLGGGKKTDAGASAPREFI